MISRVGTNRLRRLISMPGPRGALGVRTLRPRTAADRRRRLLLRDAFADQPAALAWAVQGGLWIRWIGWTSWRTTLRAWRNRCRPGSHAVAASGLSRARLLARMLYLATIHGVPSAELVRLDLWSDLGTDRVLAHVFSSETAAYHHGRNRAAGVPGGAPVSDKRRASRLLNDAGVPAVATTTITDPAELPAVLADAPHGLVVKPNTAGAMQGMFRIRPGGGTAETITGRPIDDSLDALIADLISRFGDVIATAYVPSHPTLHGLGACDDEALVVRIITVDPSDPRVELASAEIPVRDEHGSRSGYAIVEIGRDGSWGRPLPHPARQLPIPADVRLPDWDALVDAATRAHRLAPFATVYGIGWDIVVGPDGPVILEGNTTWTLTGMQRLRGPLLSADATRGR